MGGGVAGVTVKAEGGSFVVQIATRSGGVAILSKKARSGEPRHFGIAAQAIRNRTQGNDEDWREGLVGSIGWVPYAAG